MPYRGLVGAYAFAIRRSRSWLLKAYGVASALVGVYVAILLVLAVISWAGNPVAFGEKALLGVLGILVLVPLFAPVMIVARRHRLDGATRRGDAVMAAAGVAFLVSLPLALLITDPTPPSGSGSAATVVASVNGLPAVVGLVPPVAGALLLAAARWATRDGGIAG